MIDPSSALKLTSASLGSPGAGSSALPDSRSVDQFQQMLNNPVGNHPSGLVGSSLQSFVQGAEKKLKIGDVEMSKKVRAFHSNHDVEKLISAMYDSSMRSIQVQLTGKIGSKVSESFEQLIKQQ